MKTLIAWFVKNPIAANMLMLILAVSGFYGAGFLGNEMFPSIEPTSVAVTVPYPGAGTTEVEEQISKRVEEAVSDIEGIKEIRSVSRQGVSRVVIEAITGWDVQRLLSDVKSKVDGISTFPADAEKPVVSESSGYHQVMSIVVSGRLSEAELKEYAEKFKQDIQAFHGVGRVELNGTREAEMGIEISARTLREHQLSFADVTRAIRAESLNRSAGQVRGAKGDVQIQAYGQGYQAADFENIAVIKAADGSKLLLRDLADIKDGFVEDRTFGYFNRNPAVYIEVYVSEDPDLLGVSESVSAYLDKLTGTLPETLEVAIWLNFANHLGDRLEVMAKNAIQGLVLVFVLLMLFLRPVLAFWVAAGLFVAYLGAFAAMSVLGVTLSVISTFAFILILGIVVDDAIVVSEGIFAHYEKEGQAANAAIKGAQSVSKPVVIAVLTTMMVFVPILFTSERIAMLLAPMAVVVIVALLFSLIESFLILPSHLSHMRPEQHPETGPGSYIYRLRKIFSGWLMRLNQQSYQPLLDKCLRNPASTLSVFTVILMLTLSVLLGGWMKFSFMPEIEGERVSAYVDLKTGESELRKQEIRQQLEQAAYALRDEGSLINRDGSNIIQQVASWTRDDQVIVQLSLSSNEVRDVGSNYVKDKWRQQIGEIEQIEGFNLLGTAGRSADQKDITLQLRGNNIQQLEAASRELSSLLSSFEDVYSVSDSLASAEQEIVLALKPGAETLGVSLESLATQVRHAFYGSEAQRIPRLREDVRVLVRLPAEDRQSTDVLESLWIQTDTGESVPFYAVADIDYQPGYSIIRRIDRQRVVDIKANVVKARVNANEVVGQVVREYWPQMQARYPDLNLMLSGEQESQSNFAREMKVYFTLVLLVMYTLLAVEFRSYLQPVVIMSAIPFGVAGAIIGHLVLGMSASLTSILGVMATAGVVVNDNLVLLDRINRLRREGYDIAQAIRQAGSDRFRPIFLTSMTTFFGLTPLLLEKSTSTKFLQPMVVSLSFGVLLSTVVTLLCVPALYSIIETRKQKYGLAAAADVNLEADVNLKDSPEAG